MSTNRLTPLNELHLAKKKAREERAISEQRLSYQLQYLEDNWGTLLTKGLSSSVKTKFVETLDNMAQGSGNPLLHQAIGRRRSPYWVNLALSNLPVLGKITWRIVKPTVYAFTVKKLTGKLFSFNRKRK